MDRFVNKKIEKQTIYEIYRACRLCGAGGGYKMPIIQNVLNIDNCDVELNQKIRECVQIEVHQGDKMPPLICELCVDKVNDFYEFLEMCRQTNKRTRLKLGLPPQMLPRGAPDAGDCILGVTEPIFVNDEDSNEPLADKRTKAKGGKVKKEPEKKMKEVKIKLESPRESRASRRRSPTPPRRAARRHDDGETLNCLKSKLRGAVSPPPKSILKKGQKEEVSPQSSGRLKRTREPEVKREPAKRVKISLQPVPPKKTSPRQKEEEKKKAKLKEARQRELEAERHARELQTPCLVCGGVFKTPQAMMSHRRCHIVTFTNPKLACNACGAWFSSAAEAGAHHRRHARGSPYRCARCGHAAATHQLYDRHRCSPWPEVADAECAACWRTFPTRPLLAAHRCAGERARPGKCTKCGKTFTLRKSLTNHTKHCKKGDVIIPASLRRRLKPACVRVAKCDPLLLNVKRQHYDVSTVPPNYGLDKRCVYPYLSSAVRIKRELSDCMVKINDMDFGSYVHWDSSESSGSDSDTLDFTPFTKTRKVKSLAALSLRTIFSNKFLGKVPRKHRRVKIETIIDSTLNDSLSDLNLNDGDANAAGSEVISDKKVDDADDDLFPKAKGDEQVTNADFDSLFGDMDKSDSAGDKLVLDKDSDETESKHIGDGDERKNINDSDDLDNGAKDNIDEDNNITCNNNINVAKSTNELNEGTVEEEKSMDSENVQSESQFDASTNDIEEKVENNDVEKEISDDNETKIEENLKYDETEVKNHNKINTEVSNEANEDTNESQENNIEAIREEKSENNETEMVTNDGKLSETQQEIETADNKESTKVIESSIDNLKNDTKVSTDPDNDDHNKDDHDNDDHNKDDHDDDPKISEHKTANDEKQSVDGNTKMNGDAEIDDVALNMNDLEDFSGDEYDDCELMAEIDAQIGEKKDDEKVIDEKKDTEKPLDMVVDKENHNEEEKITENSDSYEDIVKDVKKDIELSDKDSLEVTKVNEKEIETQTEVKDKITLEDLLPKEDVKSMDLDSISDDEFDFND